jgi:hypothetical protein
MGWMGANREHVGSPRVHVGLSHDPQFVNIYAVYAVPNTVPQILHDDTPSPEDINAETAYTPLELVTQHDVYAVYALNSVYQVPLDVDA